MGRTGRADDASAAPARSGAEAVDSLADGGPVLRASGLVKRYGDRVALAGVDLEAARGELVACIGPNGAGKTTLLTILAGIQEPDEGRVRSQRPRPRLGATASGALQQAERGREPAPVRAPRGCRLTSTPRFAACWPRLGSRTAPASRRRGCRVGTASGSTSRSASLSEPEVLLLDEPTAALDPRQRDAAVGLHHRAGGGRHDRHLRDSQRLRGRALRRPRAGAGGRREALLGRAGGAAPDRRGGRAARLRDRVRRLPSSTRPLRNHMKPLAS